MHFIMFALMFAAFFVVGRADANCCECADPDCGSPQRTGWEPLPDDGTTTEVIMVPKMPKRP